MLQRLNTTPVAPIKRQPRGHTAVTGQSIAKGLARTRYSRAHLAALWVLEPLTIKAPTTKQASILFGVCETLIRKARRELETTTAAPLPLNAAWAAASRIDRNIFVRDHLADIWDRIDQLTG